MIHLSLADIQAAREVIGPYIWWTPLVYSPALSQLTQGQVYLKLECWQRTGSFKVRGALSRLARSTGKHPCEGVVTASAGNHGLGVAVAAELLGLPAAIVFVPENAPRAKVDRLRALHCQVHRAGADYDATQAIAEAYALDRGLTYISAYDDLYVMAGQGTVGLEIVEEMRASVVVDLSRRAGPTPLGLARSGGLVMLVPVGGGGLVAGVGVAVKSLDPSATILGVQPEASPAAHLSLRNGRAYESYPAGPTICDGLAGGFGRMPFEVARSFVESVLVIPEADVRHAVRWLVLRERLAVEGSAAIAIAPLLSGTLDVAGKRVVAILTGRNIDSALLRKILAERGDK